MNTLKATYWIALAAFALALNSEYQHGKFPALHSVAGRAESTLCRITTRAEQALTLAGILPARQHQEFRVDDDFIARQQAQVERAMAEQQGEIDRALAVHQADIDRAMELRRADLDRVQQRLDRMHIVLDRAPLHRVRVLERAHVKLSSKRSGRTIVVCPKPGTRVTVRTNGDLPGMDTDVPDIEIGDSL